MRPATENPTNKHNKARGRFVTVRRIGPKRHSAPNEFALIGFANHTVVRVMGIDVHPTADHLGDVSNSSGGIAATVTTIHTLTHAPRLIRRVTVFSTTLLESWDSIESVRVRFRMLAKKRDDCIAPLASR